MSDQGASIPPQTFVECGECGGNINISMFCKNCPISLCDKCSKIHKTKSQYKLHTVVQRTYTVLRLYGPAKIAEQCQVHPEKDILTYCNECEAPCCVSCLAKNHNGHDFSTIEDKYLDAEKGLNEYSRKLDTDVMPTIDKMEGKEIADVNVHVQKIINDINDFRKDAVMKFDRACDDLIVQAKSISRESNTNLQEIKESKKFIMSLKHMIEDKIEKGNLDIISYAPPQFESLIPDLKTSPEIVSWFEPAENIVIEKPVGKIHVREKASKKRRMIQKRSSAIPIIVKKVNSFESVIEVTAIIKAFDSKAWVIDSGNEEMHLYDHKGKVVSSVTVESSQGIKDMAITRSGGMLITCEDMKVRGVALSGKMSILIDTAPFMCTGVCVTCIGEIAVCMDGQDDRNHVGIYTPDGRRKLREISGKEDGYGKRVFTDPQKVIPNGQELCVLNYGKDVVCVNEYDVMWLYRGKQAKLSKPFDPRSICVDKHHNLLVTDGDNHCVHYVDSEGLLIKVILTQKQIGLQYHWGICVDDDTGHIWVGNRYSSNVVIAKYLE
ncbi:hypothetical protein FSP39_012477 [Pinctada imbricata]|uniref:B box-type domain-containing protein n=1 Tax=Pinctada imbricata TaxID=66713 RepID=A0AA88XUF7_PINIB|nr:hypothetical protein FSP39_012477 [Pinctada imbricata]